MNNRNYILGLDMGVGSVGWACMLLNDEGEPCRVLDNGVMIFDPQGELMEDRRKARGTRRLIRRKQGRVSRTKQLFVSHNYLNMEYINNYYARKGVVLPDVYETRLKGKTEPLRYDELLVILINYAKGRGFKSNRKEVVEEKNNDETKMLAAKKQTEEKIAIACKENANYTITNLLKDEAKRINRYRNSSEDYHHIITRKMIEDEVTIILNKQVECGVISEEFADIYLNDILLAQRNFAAGPDHGPYSNALEKMIGKCRFTKKPRASVDTLSYQFFTLVQKLNDIRYLRKDDKTRYALTGEQIGKIVDMALQGKVIKYETILKVIGEDVYFPGINLIRKDYMEVINKIRENPSLDKNSELNNKKSKLEVYSLKSYKKLRTAIKKSLGSIPELDVKQYDLLAECFARCKSDEEILHFINDKNSRAVLNDVDLPQEIIENLINFNVSFSGFGKVSLEFIDDVLPIMKEGKDFYTASKEKGYDILNNTSVKLEGDLIPEINKILEDLDKTITNKGVVRTLAKSRTLVNEIVKKYGKPQAIHIEMARDLPKSDKERREISDQQFLNQETNKALKVQIYNKHSHIFANVDRVSSTDILKYKLFIEQNGICPYTLASTNDENQAKIIENKLFTDEYEIDHIVPYSITHDDRMVNKALVKKSENITKGNRLPGEFYKGSAGYAKYKAFVSSNKNIDTHKVERYLEEKIDESMLNDYRARTENDTRYAIKAFKEILSKTFGDVKINTITGQMTAMLRGVWGLNNLCNSYRSKDYRIKTMSNDKLREAQYKLAELIEQGFDKKSKEFRKQAAVIKDIEKSDNLKNREDHLHHIVDAAIIACSTNKMRRAIEIHQQYLNSVKSSSDKFVVKFRNFDDNGEEIGVEEIEMSGQEYLDSRNINFVLSKKPRFPQPYPYFRDEIILRTYEMNKEILQAKLTALNLDTYTKEEIASISPVFVYHSYKRKTTGALHEATKYGVRETENGSQLVVSMKLKSEKFTKKHLEKIYDKEKSQKYIYEAIKDWLSEPKENPTGVASYIANGNKYPINKNGNPITKVKILNGEVKEAIEVKPNSKQYVAKENIQQIYVYKKENVDKLYFAGMDLFRLNNLERRDDLDLILWGGGKTKCLKIKSNELRSNGFISKPKVFYKGQTVKITLNNGNTCYVKIVGFTQALLEVQSIVGDYYDLLDSKVINNIVDRIRLSVNTIKSIKPVKLTKLGKLKK